MHIGGESPYSGWDATKLATSHAIWCAVSPPYAWVPASQTPTPHGQRQGVALVSAAANSGKESYRNNHRADEGGRAPQRHHAPREVPRGDGRRDALLQQPPVAHQAHHLRASGVRADAPQPEATAAGKPTTRSNKPGRADAREARARPAIPPPDAAPDREYWGKRLCVKVVEGGFEFTGKICRSLSAVACEATGTTWSGLLFFHLITHSAGGRWRERRVVRDGRTSLTALGLLGDENATRIVRDRRTREAR